MKEALASRREGRFLIRFAYKNDWFFMWRVTWAYVVEDVCRRK